VTRLAVFDLDGTLVDSRRDVAQAVLHGLAAVGGNAVQETALYACIGRPLDDIFRELLGGDDDEARVQRAADAYRTYYFDHCADHTTPYPGAREALAALDGRWTKAVCTNKRTYMAKRLLDLLDLSHHFGVVLGADDLPHKPDPAMLKSIMDRFAAAPATTVMIGDTWMDVEAGRRAGAKTCGAAFGDGARAELLEAGPDRIIEAFAELPDALRALTGE